MVRLKNSILAVFRSEDGRSQEVEKEQVAPKELLLGVECGKEILIGLVKC